MGNVSGPNIQVSVSNEKETVMQKIKDGLYHVKVKFWELNLFIIIILHVHVICHFNLQQFFLYILRLISFECDPG